MEEVVAIKQEPEWIIDDDGFINSQYYKDDQQSHSITEYEIKPYYIPAIPGNNYHFDDLNCKVRPFFFLFFIFIFDTYIFIIFFV